MAVEEKRKELWKSIFGTDKMPEDETKMLQQVHRSSAIGGKEEPTEIVALVRAIVGCCGEDPVDDLSEFIDDGSPTEYFYETVAGFLSRGIDPLDSTDETDDSLDDDDDQDDNTLVSAQPRMFGLDTLYNLVNYGQLDLNPPWQRTVVWSPAKQRDLIKSILLGIPIPSIILHHRNPGQIEERYSIIDGKQRLTSICRFLDNQFKLPSFAVSADHPLYRCRSRWFDKPGKKMKNLDAPYRNRIMTTQIPVLLFEQVKEGRLRQIFNLYNVTATRLNAAEIRNAVYQRNEIYQTLFVLSGEAPGGGVLPFLDAIELERFIAALRTVLPSTKRFAPLDFICRYLGYSRAPVSSKLRPGVFRTVSTSAVINRYFDFCAPNDDPEEIAREIMHVFERASDFFDLEDDGEFSHMAFFRRNQKGERRFEALQAITSMVCARLLDRVETLSHPKPEEIETAVRQTVEMVTYPETQQYTTIWDYQARMFLTLVNNLGIDLGTFDGGAFKLFGDRLGQVRLEGTLGANGGAT